ncbi:acyl-CoA dehydrogenase family protein [Bradyrhizobium elkanii]|uniref:acyl-CoA dehydrogenase family protein n=1 Tax=Bradyrhizobium elkanii TaxID=29448 RepID=UPI001BAD6A7A|nr:acyl-CoA dehydrogenase family protein [Bradyrhizobium elkanii]MBR1159447.1 acyl-CoA dehydrogenase family protein [Bradyrhizobium elkanii]
MIRDVARRFARERLLPFGREWDRAGAFPRSLLPEMGNLGLFGILAPQEYGGLGGGYLTWAVALEEIAAGNGGISTLMHVHALGTAGVIANLGNAEQKAQWLPRMIAGEAIGCVALTEPHAGSDVSRIKTRARKVDGGWRLDGAKQFISNGRHASVAIILAVTDPDAGSRGMSFFLVPTDTPGFRVGNPEEKLGQTTSDTVPIVLEDCFVPEAAMMGEHGQALPATMGLLSDGRISIAAQAVGMARAAFEAALDYAQERKAFGKAIIDHQAVAFRLADMATQIEVARAYTHHAARLLDAGADCVKEASIAKLFAGEMAERVCSDAIQIHGGYGYLADYQVERIYRDVRVCQIYEGTNDIQRLIIARKLRT